MAYYTDLSNVPMFTFIQDGENPINIHYYNGSIALAQGDESILINTDSINQLFTAIKKNLPDANQLLENRNK